MQELIDMFDLKGAVVTADAMHCQTATAERVIEKEADYILFVKGNQSTLQKGLESAILDAFSRDNRNIRQQHTSEKNRNREEFRSMMVMPVPKGSPVFSRWEGICTIGQIFRTRECNGKVEEEVTLP